VEFGYSSVIGENIQFYVKDTGVGIEIRTKRRKYLNIMVKTRVLIVEIGRVQV